MADKPQRQPVRSLRRYIHTQGFTRLSGNRRVEPLNGFGRARAALVAFFVIISLIGLGSVYL